MNDAPDISAEERFTALQGAVLQDQVVADLMRDAQVGIWRYDPDSDLYNFSSELDLGYQQGITVIPRGLLERVQHPDDAPLDAAIRARLTTQVGEAEAEMRYRHSAGHWVHLRVHYRTGAQLPSGLYEMCGISQNVTAQSLARDAARASAHQLKMAMTGAGAGAFDYDVRTGGYAPSDELARLIGARGLQRLKIGAKNIFHPDDRQAVEAFRKEAEKSGQPRPIDVRVIGPKGYFWARLFFEVDRSAGGDAARGVGLIIDIDAAKRQQLALEEARKIAEAATAAKSTFLASVSHEIRTPLNGVSGILHLLKNEPLSKSARLLVDQALDCGQMLGQLINDILDFSKIEAGKLEMTPAPTDVAAAVDSVLAMLRPGAEDKGLWLRSEVPANVGWAMIDPLRLRQCLFNVTGNAIKFTRQGGVELRLSLSGEGAGQRLRCEIEDTGIGIPDSAKPLLFDRFQQAETGTTRKFGGTGLGLAISRTLARMMGGDMGFDSIEGRGSTFWFEIAAPVCAPAEAEANLSAMNAPLTGLRVLVVDDNAINLLVAGKTVEAMGAEIETVDSGPGAIEALRLGDYDLVLMDINMPGMDGMEATRRIRALPNAMAGVPVIALTADVMSHQRANYLAAGMNGVAPKPFSPTDLLAEIARLMNEDGNTAAAAAAAAAG